MSGCWLPDHAWWVALRKESVDRNDLEVDGVSYDVWASLSARRAWIEMQISVSTVVGVLAVALRKESVDRNVMSSSGKG